MAGPWEKYQGVHSATAVPDAATPAAGPWTKYAPAQSVQAAAIRPAAQPAAPTVVAPAVEAAPQEEPGVLDKIGSFFTGSDRETRATNELPELQKSGILASSGLSAAKQAQLSATIALTQDPEEIAKILQSASPDIGIQYDEKGNILAANNKTGARTVINKPGVSALDALQAGAMVGAFAPAALAAPAGAGVLASTAAIGGASALTETAIQGAQQAAGGEFSASDVALSGAAGAGGELLARGLSAAVRPIGAGIARRTDEAEQLREALTAQRAGAASPTQAQLLEPFDVPVEVGREGVARTVVQSASPAARSSSAIDRLAAEARPDQSILDAAERLGVQSKMIPSQFSGSQTYREIEQALASIPGSHLNAQQKEAATALAQKADDLIATYGGTIDKASLSDRFKQQGVAGIEDLERQSSALYDQVSTAIAPTARAPAPNTVAYLQNKVTELGDKSLLSAVERRTLGALSRVDGEGNPIMPTYAALDMVRKQVGEGLRGRGPFKDSESGSLSRLYGALSEDQQVIADAAGAGDAFRAAKSLVAQRKSVEEAMRDVLGKDLSGALTSATGNAVKRLGSGDFKQFDRLMDRIPEGMRQEVAVSALNDVFTAGSRAEKQLSAPGFVDWYAGLSRTPAAKQRLEKHLPEGASKQLKDIYTVAKGMRDASSEHIHTGRLNSIKLLEDYSADGGMLSRVMDTGKKVAAAEGVTSSIGIPGAGSVGVIATLLAKQKTPIQQSAVNLLASQRFREAIDAYVRSGGALSANVKKEEARLLRTPIYKKWVASLSDEARARVATVGPLNYIAGED